MRLRNNCLMVLFLVGMQLQPRAHASGDCETHLQNLEYLKQVAVKARQDGQVEIAEKYLLEVLQLSPRDPDAHAILSSIYYGQEHFENSLKHALLALDAQGETIRNLKNVIRASIRAGRLDFAELYVRRALAAFPDESRFQNQQAQLELLHQNPLLALRLLEVMIQRKTADRYTLKLRAKIKSDFIVGRHRNEESATLGRRTKNLIHQKRYHEALESAEEQLKRNPQDVYATGMKAQILLHLGDLIAALQVADTSLRIEAQNPAALGMKTKILLAMNRPKEALALAEKQLELDSTCPFALDAAAKALLGLDRLKEALEIANLEIELYPRHTGGYFLKARILNRLRDYEGALEELRKSLAIEGDDTRALGFYEHLLKKSEMWGLRRDGMND